MTSPPTVQHDIQQTRRPKRRLDVEDTDRIEIVSTEYVDEFNVDKIHSNAHTIRLPGKMWGTHSDECKNRLKFNKNIRLEVILYNF